VSEFHIIALHDNVHSACSVARSTKACKQARDAAHDQMSFMRDEGLMMSHPPRPPRDDH